MRFIKNYKSTIILMSAIIIGSLIGIIFKEKANVLKPFGDLFINYLLIIIVPLIFLTITTSIGKMNTPKKLGKIILNSFIIFIITSIISVLIGFTFTKSTKLINIKDKNVIKETLKTTSNETKDDVNILDKIVNTVSVSDFNNLLSNENIIALIVFSVLLGLAINLSKEKGNEVLLFLNSANNVLQKFIKIIMYYAPIGLGCYFASIVGSFGSSLIKGYIKMFLVYILCFVFMYFVIYSIYALLAGGKKGLKKYWKNIIPPTLYSLSTCSSAASIPINIKSSTNMGVDEEISNLSIPLGTNFHKEGSIIGSVFKIMFLVYLFNSNTSNIRILLIALLATLLVSAVPIGGGTISETLIITMLGFPLSVLPILTLIATIIDAPATVLNVTGNTISSVLIDKSVNKKTYYENSTKDSS